MASEKNDETGTFPRSSFQVTRDESEKEFLSIILELSELMYREQYTHVSVARVKHGLDTIYIQDKLESLGYTDVEHRSFSKVEVRVCEDFLVVTNTPTAKDCIQLVHNQNIFFNIEMLLEDAYLKRRQHDERKKV